MSRADYRRALRDARRDQTRNDTQAAILQAVEDAAADPIPEADWTPAMRRMAEIWQGADAIPGEPPMPLSLRQMISVTRALSRAGDGDVQ